MPMMSLREARKAAMESRILCPACRWSNVPPRATTGKTEGSVSFTTMLAGCVGADSAGVDASACR